MIQEVTVKKTQLLETLKKNRENHVLVYKKAVELWKKGMKESAEKFYKQIVEKDKFDASFDRMQKPDLHKRDYDIAIEMLEFSVEDEFKLDRQTFQNLVMDDWNFTRAFYANAMSLMERQSGRSGYTEPMTAEEQSILTGFTKYCDEESSY